MDDSHEACLRNYRK